MKNIEERANDFRGWIFIAGMAVWVVAGWFMFEAIRFKLGDDLAGSFLAFLSVFVTVGILELGNRAKWWYLEKYRR